MLIVAKGSNERSIEVVASRSNSFRKLSSPNESTTPAKDTVNVSMKTDCIGGDVNLTKQRLIVCLVWLTCASCITGARAQDAPYRMYENQKVVTEMEWRLLQAQQPLSAKEAYITFDSMHQRFDLTVWITTVDAARQSARETRDSFLSVVKVASALLGLHFPEFQARGSHDIRARLLLGRSGAEELAVFDGNSVRFSDRYFEFLEEIGRR